ncbi:hypothetical protein [Marinobacter sp. F3R08]|uniref:hypothetical protein n=1 Tax=Marinobacter sp. F3R08 TaxID=2841559 RepID=UPI001C092D19|nr:hypothetical protein [Marinobacter sp. F3R08]MBU2954597.1 hypothetical protein [Marinobacter sp. F3R08]
MMKFQNNDSIIDILKIQLRYVSLFPVFFVGVVLWNVIGATPSVNLGKTAIIIFVLTFITLIFTTYNSYKYSSKQFIEVDTEKLVITNNYETETIDLGQVNSFIIYNILGNKNLVITLPDKTTGFLLNSFSDGLLFTITEKLGEDKIIKSNLLGTIKFVLGKSS